jgi:hypothetical protein
VPVDVAVPVEELEDVVVSGHLQTPLVDPDCWIQTHTGVLG